MQRLGHFCLSKTTLVACLSLFLLVGCSKDASKGSQGRPMLPLGVLGAIVATSLRGFPNDVYFQIGFLTTLGLSTKNAILIIQFIQERMPLETEHSQLILK